MTEVNEKCVEEVMRVQGKTREEAIAICNEVQQRQRSKPKEVETTSKNLSFPNMIQFAPIARPTIESPKHSQEYCGYNVQTPFPSQKCEGCAFFIQGNGTQDNQCQLVNSTPSRILLDGWCRFWKSVYTLEGYIPAKEPVDDSLPEDIKALIQENDVE